MKYGMLYLFYTSTSNLKDKINKIEYKENLNMKDVVNLENEFVKERSKSSKYTAKMKFF